MRRKDREVTDFGEILAIFRNCEILRLGLADGDFPYVVPVNFAPIVEGEKIAFVIHGALAGRKYELMSKNGVCSFEMDMSSGIALDEKSRSATTLYESVMGTARIDFLEGDEKQSAIDVFMSRYDATRNFDYNKANVAAAFVAKLTVLSLSAKANRKPPAKNDET